MDLTKKKTQAIYVPVIPKALRFEILLYFHDNEEFGGHLGFKATLKRLKRRCFWDKMVPEIREYIKTCETCQTSKAVRQLPYGLMQPLEVTKRVFGKIFVDYLGPLVKSKKQNSYCLIVVDHLSKFLEVFPVRSAVGKKTAEILKDEIFLRYGPPQTIVE